MAKVNWTFQALEDIDDIGEYLSQNAPRYASYLIALFFEQTKLLETFPKSGRIVPETNLDTIRELIVKNYRIIYSISSSDQIDILAVRSSKLPFDMK